MTEGVADRYDAFLSVSRFADDHEFSDNLLCCNCHHRADILSLTPPAVSHVGGSQATEPFDPFVTNWNREILLPRMHNQHFSFRQPLIPMKRRLKNDSHEMRTKGEHQA
jgi:hypothetical protein